MNRTLSFFNAEVYTANFVFDNKKQFSVKILVRTGSSNQDAIIVLARKLTAGDILDKKIRYRIV